MTIDQSRLQAIRERHEKATPGEWRSVDCWAGGQHLPFADSRIIFSEEGREIAALIDNTDTGIDDTENAEFIAHAHQDIPYLLDQVTALQAEAKAGAALMLEAREAVQASIREICPHCTLPRWRHKPDCLVTRLRGQAEKMEGGLRCIHFCI